MLFDLNTYKINKYSFHKLLRNSDLPINIVSKSKFSITNILFKKNFQVLGIYILIITSFIIDVNPLLFSKTFA